MLLRETLRRVRLLLLLELLRLWRLLNRGLRHRHRGLPLRLWLLLWRVTLRRVRMRGRLLLLVLRG